MEANVPGDSDVQAEPPAATSEPLVVEVEPDLPGEQLGNDPWPYLKNFFGFRGREGENVRYECCLCSPKHVVIRAHASSLANLRSHVKRMHPDKLKEFEDAVAARRLKRPSGDSETSLRKKQMTISSWAASGSGVRQSGVDRRVVDFFVANMLPLQVF
jgi:hypothetical protein